MKDPSGKIPFAKKSFGQNFLVDQNVIDRIVTSLTLSEADTVIEIGPGRGALTERLLENAGTVIAIELDRDMAALLREKFANRQNFQLYEQNALDFDFAKLAGGSGTFKLAANLPYYISTAILQHLIDHRTAFSQLVLMFQREVVDRIVAAPSTPERGFLTVIVEAYMSVEKFFDVPPSAFRPAPKIWSSVVRMLPKDPVIADPKKFREVVSAGFAQRRKTILNNLKAIDKDAAAYLGSAGIDPNRRAESLTLDEWMTLASQLQ